MLIDHSQKNCDSLAEFIVKSMSLKDLMRTMADAISADMQNDNELFRSEIDTYEWIPGMK